jgi:hypothetical protein
LPVEAAAWVPAGDVTSEQCPLACAGGLFLIIVGVKVKAVKEKFALPPKPYYNPTSNWSGVYPPEMETENRKIREGE